MTKARTALRWKKEVAEKKQKKLNYQDIINIIISINMIVFITVFMINFIITHHDCADYHKKNGTIYACVKTADTSSFAHCLYPSHTHSLSLSLQLMNPHYRVTIPVRNITTLFESKCTYSTNDTESKGVKEMQSKTTVSML